jgi:arylamine N-acetyltransferase
MAVNDNLCRQYLKMMDVINTHYPSSLFRWIEIFHRDKDRELQAKEDRINEVWELNMSGTETLMDFLKALKEYKALMGNLIRLYVNRNKRKK